MLKDAEAMATVAVRDMARARTFYEGQLGLEAVQAEEAMVAYRCAGSTLLVYQSAVAGSNKANAATFSLRTGLAELVRELQGKGVVFEHYDLPGMARDGALHRGGGRTVAWCKDPDGNILCLAQD